MGSWMGVNQSGSWPETCEVAKTYIDKGQDVRLTRVDFGEGSEEHSAIEYEVWVYFEEESR